MTLGTCATRRDITWDAYRDTGRCSIRAPRAALQLAVDACLSCPRLKWCEQQPAVPGMVQAAYIYDAKGNRFGSVHGFLRRSSATVPACRDDEGSMKGYRLHQSLRESACTACATAYSRYRRAQRQRARKTQAAA